MAERPEETEAELDVGSEPISPAAAMAIGLHKGREGPATDPTFDAFLEDQRRLINLQTEHLHEQRTLILSRLRWGRFSDRIKALLQVLTLLVGLAVAGAIAVMAWQAHEDRGVAIEAFSVPPDFAQRGLTGQVVASQLLDRLSQLQAETATYRPASSYANDWGDDIKVEIPETGVSIGELNRYLRQSLGSETRISGEIVRTPAGVAVTARAGETPAHRFEGAEADVDKLIAQAAGAVYDQTQPYRYAVYLATHGQANQALQIYARLAQSGAREDRAWANLGWAALLAQKERQPREALRKVDEAIRLDPRIVTAYGEQLNINFGLGRPEGVIASGRSALRLLDSSRAEGISPQAAPVMHVDIADVIIPQLFGDYARVLEATQRTPEDLDLEGGGSFTSQTRLAQAYQGLHDTAALLRQFPAGLPIDWRVSVAELREDWRQALEEIDQLPAPERFELSTQAGRAVVLAHLGRIGEAEAAIAPTPLDCTDCLGDRGEIAAYAGDRTGVDHWFGEAVRQAPLPPYYLRWGRSLLLLGDPGAAIVELKEAHRLGPHFADPLEVWGEALMAKRDDAGAISKFAEADKDAPKWGHNHLRWGEALMLSGRYAEARAQYQIASGLDLSVGDRAALNVLLARTARGPLHG